SRSPRGAAASAPLPRAGIGLHGGHRYALRRAAVRRVTEMAFGSRGPRAPPALLGVVSRQGRVAALIDLGPLVGLKARPARPEGKVVMLQRPRGDVGLYVSEVAGMEEMPAEASELKEPSGGVRGQGDSAEGRVR